MPMQLIWSQQTNGASNVDGWTNRRPANGAWGTAEKLDRGIPNPELGNDFDTKLETNSTGDAFIIFSKNNGTRNILWALHYSVVNGWDIGATAIDKSTFGRSSDQVISINQNGESLAIWLQQNPVLNRINVMTNNYTLGKWNTAARIDSENLNAPRNPRVKIDKYGNGIAIWEQNDGNRWRLWAARYIASSGWQTAELIENKKAGITLGDSTTIPDIPQLKIDDSGEVIMVWEQLEGTRRDIWVNHFE